MPQRIVRTGCERRGRVCVSVWIKIHRQWWSMVGGDHVWQLFTLQELRTELIDAVVVVAELWTLACRVCIAHGFVCVKIESDFSLVVVRSILRSLAFCEIRFSFLVATRTTMLLLLLLHMVKICIYGWNFSHVVEWCCSFLLYIFIIVVGHHHHHHRRRRRCWACRVHVCVCMLSIVSALEACLFICNMQVYFFLECFRRCCWLFCCVL